MKLIRTFVRPLDLESPAKPGEVVYKTLGLSRLFRFVRRRLTILLIATLVGLLLNAGYTWLTTSTGNERDANLARTNHRLQRALDDIVQARKEGRFTTCRSDRRFELDHNSLVQADQDNIATLLDDAAKANPDPAQKASIVEYAKARVARFELSKVPVRKCDEAAITEFYESSGELGCEPAANNSEGRCVSE